MVATSNGVIDAGQLVGPGLSLATTVQGTLPQVAIGAPRDGCLADAGCAGAVLVWDMGATPQQRALVRGNGDMALGTDVAIGRFTGSTNVVFAAAPFAPSPFIIDLQAGTLHPMVGSFPGVTTIELGNLPGRVSGLYFGQLSLSWVIGVVFSTFGLPKTSSYSISTTIECPGLFVGEVVATGLFDNDLEDDVVFSNPSTNTVAVALSSNALQCVVLPTPSGIGATAEFGRSLAFRGVGANSSLLVGAPRAEVGGSPVGAVFEYQLCEVTRSCVDAGPMDAGARLDAGVTMDAGARLDAGVTMDASVAMDASVVMDASVTMDASVMMDASVVMDASVMMDAGLATDGGPPASRVTFVPVCGCTSAPAPFLLLAVTLLALRRRSIRPS